jgi:hypothetical protein
MARHGLDSGAPGGSQSSSGKLASGKAKPLRNIKSAHVLLFLLLLMGPFSIVRAQTDDEAALAGISARVQNYFSRQRPEWKHQSVTPMAPSHLTNIHQWEGVRILFDKQTREEWPVQLKVRVTIMLYPTEESAHAALEAFVTAQQRTRRKASAFAIGDEGYEWGIYLAAITFRKGRYLFFADTVAAPDFGAADKRGLATRVTEEVVKEVARAVSAT